MPDEPKVYCPLCGNLVPTGLAKCPVCNTDLGRVKPRAAPLEGIGIPAFAGTFLHKEIPRVELPKSNIICPLCALELKGGEAKCPRCGIPLVLEQKAVEVPEPKPVSPEPEKAAPEPEIVPISVPEPPATPAIEPPTPLPAFPPASEPVPELEAPKPPPAAPSYGEEGLVNGRGFVNGTGLAATRGAINGTGLVNGTGMSEIERAESGARSRGRQHALFVGRWQFLAVLVAVIVVISAFVFLSYPLQKAPVSVDGDFGEWASIQKFGMYTAAGSAPIDVDQWAVETDGYRVFVYVKAEGSIMESTQANSFYLFIDNDNSASTGYSVSGIGADYLMEMDGWNGSVRSTSTMEYLSGTDKYDWNSWSKLGTPSASISGTQLEASADLPVLVGSSAKFLLVSKDGFDRSALSHPVPQKGGLLIVNQMPGPGVQTDGIVPVSSSVTVLRLELTCDGAGGRVENIVPTVLGATSSFTFNQVDVNVGDTVIVDIAVDTSTSFAGALVEAFVPASDITSEFASIRVLGSSVRAYVSLAPSIIQIDGAFADWAGLTSPDADSLSIGNENVDVNSVGAVNTTSSSFFYVSVFGDMLGGSYVPVLVSKPSGGGGGIVIPSKKTGEDFLRVYIDSDLSASTGYLMTAASKFIGAEYRIEIRGLDGEVKSKALYSYSAGQWTAVTSATLSAANDRQRIELGVSSFSISGSSSIDFVIEATDWRGRSDVATAVPQPGRSISGSATPSPGMNGWIVDGSGTSSTATATSYQRKLFYDGTNFWSIYWNGTDTLYRYSIDSGVTWVSMGPVFKTVGMNKVSIWWDSSTSMVYAVGDSSTSSRKVWFQRGVVTPATHSITWENPDRSEQVSSNAYAGKNTFISRDSSGYIWIIATNLTSMSPARYDLTVLRSASPNSVAGAWLHRGNMLDADASQQNLKGSVLPAGSGSDMWAVYGYDGTVASRKFTSGVWSAQTNIFTWGTGSTILDIAPPCAVVDGNGVIHVVYGNDHEQPAGTPKPFVYYVSNAGLGWSVPFRLDSVGDTLGNLYPTISVDSSTAAVYAFWIETDTIGVGTTVMAKKNVQPYLNATWTALALPGQTPGAKQYLTSVYSVSGELNICWQWTQNTSYPNIQVIFDKIIPEFDGLVLPVFLLMIVSISLMGRTRIGRKR